MRLADKSMTFAHLWFQMMRLIGLKIGANATIT